MKAVFIGFLFAAAALAPLHGVAGSVRSASQGPLYGYINTQAFADGAKEFYLKTIASDDGRAKLISQAKEECGGRYEGTSLGLIELSHIIETDKRAAVGSTKNYTVPYFATASVHWLVVETISCSMHGGHNHSVLHAALLSGAETQLVTYKFVNDQDLGGPAVSDLQRVYKIEADELSDQYRIPYSEQ
jgi:hypothetical protein